MVKKAKNTSASSGDAGDASNSAATGPVSGLLDNQLAHLVKDSAQHIWLAGMGAFSKAQEGRNKVFEALVKEGVGLQKKTQGLAEDKINEVTGKMSAMAGSVTAKAGQNWDKLESIFEQRTAKAMNRLGVPTAKDVDALVKRVDELAAAVAKLSRATAAQAPRTPRAAVPTKSRQATAAAPAKAVLKRPRKSASA